MSIKSEHYVTTYLPYAKAAGEKFKMDPLIILSQGAHESAWGTSGLAVNSNNFFGITAGGSPNEFWDGKIYQAQNQYKLKFRVYPTPQDSFYDFARLIASKYKSAHSVANDYKAYAQKISYSPYISESNGDNREGYRTSIINLYEKILDIAKKKSLAITHKVVAEGGISLVGAALLFWVGRWIWKRNNERKVIIEK